MKTTFLVFVMMFGTLMFANAQQAAKKINPFSLEALQEVHATDQQKQKFKNLEKEYNAKLKAIRSNSDLGSSEKREEIKKLNQYRNKVYWREILTKEQAAMLREKLKAANNTGS